MTPALMLTIRVATMWGVGADERCEIARGYQRHLLGCNLYRAIPYEDTRPRDASVCRRRSAGWRRALVVLNDPTDSSSQPWIRSLSAQSGQDEVRPEELRRERRKRRHSSRKPAMAGGRKRAINSG